MSDYDTQTSMPRKKSLNKINPEGCCIKDCLFNYHSQSNLKPARSEKSQRKRKITLFSSQQSHIEKNISFYDKRNQISITPILQPQLPRGSSLQKLMSSASKVNQPMRRSCIVGSQSLKPKVSIKITTKPLNVYKNIEPYQFSKIQTNMLTYSSINSNPKNKPSLNAIKTSKININPLVITRPSSVMKVSYEPSTNIKQKYLKQYNQLQKSMSSTKNFSNEPSNLFRSTAETPIFSNLDIISTQQINYFSHKAKQFEPVSQESSPRLYRSIVSYSQGPSFTENNTSEVILKIPVMGAHTDLHPEDLRRDNSFMKKKEKKGNSRTMTFAEEGTSDISGDVSDDDRLSAVISSWRKFNSFEEYFTRGGFIGSGRVSTVYKVEDKKTKLIVASKQVFKKLVYEKFSPKQMNKDINLHFKLPYHKNILSLYGTFEDTGRYYFLTQLCQTNLRNQMKQKIKQQQAIQYLKNILSGLQVLHQHKIIHKHLKPQNILMFSGVCKVSDFGWAGRLLQMNNHFPSYQYASPEMASNMGDVNEKTDCWSVGIIAYEMVVGQLPIDSSIDMLEANKSKLSMLSVKYKRMLEGLLQIDPNNRFTASRAIEILEEETIPKFSLKEIQKLIA